MCSCVFAHSSDPQSHLGGPTLWPASDSMISQSEQVWIVVFLQTQQNPAGPSGWAAASAVASEIVGLSGFVQRALHFPQTRPSKSSPRKWNMP